MAKNDGGYIPILSDVVTMAIEGLEETVKVAVDTVLPDDDEDDEDDD